MSSDESTPAADEVMCQCSGTKRDNIKNLFEQGMDINAISRWTGALSGCGGCEWDIADFLKELAEQQNDQSVPTRAQVNTTIDNLILPNSPR
jgi:bacterioferritin-associated ferredoxin